MKSGSEDGSTEVGNPSEGGAGGQPKRKPKRQVLQGAEADLGTEAVGKREWCRALLPLAYFWTSLIVAILGHRAVARIYCRYDGIAYRRYCGKAA